MTTYQQVHSIAGFGTGPRRRYYRVTMHGNGLFFAIDRCTRDGGMRRGDDEESATVYAGQGEDVYEIADLYDSHGWRAVVAMLIGSVDF